ncbi:MAG TPA: hypothetical protein PLJ60_08475 [Chryseolinea sp.]|nr:hypothetical protein [Chryseolinea sp.]
MKHLSRILSLLILVSAGLFLANCGGSDPKPKSDEEVQLGKLSGTWGELVSAELDGVERKDDFPGLKLKISGLFEANGDYDYDFIAGTRPTPSPWPKADKWSFGSDVNSKIIRKPDDLIVSYVVDDTQLTLSLDCPSGGCDFAGGRVGSNSGTWVFVFNK